MTAWRCMLFSGCLALVLITPGWAQIKDGAVLQAMEGKVRARLVQVPQWHEASLRTFYGAGDSLLTGRRSRAELSFTDGTVTRLGPFSLLQLPKQRQDGFMRLILGRVWLKVTKQHAPMLIRTPSAVATVVGTELIAGVDSDETSQISCLEGKVTVQGLTGPTITLKPGETVSVRSGFPVEKPTPFVLSQLQESDPILKGLTPPKVTPDDDPEGYRTLMESTDDGREVSAPPPVAEEGGTATP